MESGETKRRQQISSPGLYFSSAHFCLHLYASVLLNNLSAICSIIAINLVEWHHRWLEDTMYHTIIFLHRKWPQRRDDCVLILLGLYWHCQISADICAFPLVYRLVENKAEKALTDLGISKYKQILSEQKNRLRRWFQIGRKQREGADIRWCCHLYLEWSTTKFWESNTRLFSRSSVDVGFTKTTAPGCSVTWWLFHNFVSRDWFSPKIEMLEPSPP